jgi:oxygen-independent coproporphyrinogen-3 oxidase
VSHLYIHVPFCRRRCTYCDFSIAVRREIPSGLYADAIRAEVAMLRRDGEWPSEPLETIYFGGGTPSLLDSGALAAILRDSAAATPPREDAEITLEANPEDVTPERALAWRGVGVNRISLGAQSFDERVLRWMHRSHDGARTVAAVRQLRDAGFANISLDLIFALPAELERDWERDVDQALELEPAHVSLYGLTIEERTPLARWVSRGATAMPDDERYAREYLQAHERLARAGYDMYEVSNAARPGRRSRHNSAYWSGAAYTGLGPAAHSYDGAARCWNTAAWEAYRSTVQGGRSPREQRESLTSDQLHLERLYLGLRTTEGIPESWCPAERRAAWAARGWVERRAGRIACTAEGWLRLDALVRELSALTGNRVTSQIVTAKEFG